MERQWRMIADRNAREYRKKKAYISGVEEAKTAAYTPTDRYDEAVRWVWAIEAVGERLKKSNPEKYAFFQGYYGLSGPRFGHSDAVVLVRLCDKLHVSRSTVSAWRQEIQEMLLIAAAQAGVVEPF